MFNKDKKYAPTMLDKAINLGSVIALSVIMTGCAGMSERLNNVGKDPEMSKITNPKLDPDYREVSIPLPEQHLELQQMNSLWSSQTDRRSFFKDNRAAEVGDILTVLIDIQDEASLENSTERSRTAAEDLDIPSVAGFGDIALSKLLPDGATATDLVNLGSTTNNSGEGKIEREEEIDLKVAAMVTQTLPNGNMVIHGRQEVRVNQEVRELEIAGIIRPSDVSTDNTIGYEKIAEARVSYGGRGVVSDVQKPRYGNEVLDIILPF